ncbi:NADH:ubiquinone oxidoreductase 17.2 kD subunit [invertebrate metagenome]|uniref:NADH:ubiquinone oxidoreductase 17.2 kD subunit n=1 Tax=invertebrate metagenome TaxID=1711999 RepID=A0A484H835_9ZZZZ
MTVGTRLFTWLKGKLVGVDSYGNRYYRNAVRSTHSRERRWVLYNGMPEASKVPPEWHVWLHHTVDVPLPKVDTRPWQKEHMPNLTGTPNRYLPPGHEERGGKRDRATGDYEAWRPE